MKAGMMIVVAGMVAGSAAAQSLNISIMGRVGDGGSWSSDVASMPGQTVQVGIFMSGDASVYGMGGATLRLTATGMTDMSVGFAPGTSTGRVRPFDFGGAVTNQIFTTANGFRIDAAADADNSSTAAGLTFGQRDPSTAGANFTTSNPALVFRFDITFGAPGTGEILYLRLDELARGVASYYEQPNSRVSTRAAATLNDAVIRVPAPASSVILAGVGVFGRRRRR